MIGHGWSEPVRDGVGFRFSNVRRSWLRVPILTPGDFEVTLRIRAAFDAAPVSVSLEAAERASARPPCAASGRR